eukprot:gene11757-11903_t
MAGVGGFRGVSAAQDVRFSKEWVARRVTELLGIEEEVLISMIHNHLIDQELWAMLHSASSNESGVPQQLLDAKQQELRERREREAAIQDTVETELVSLKAHQQAEGLAVPEDKALKMIVD